MATKTAQEKAVEKIQEHCNKILEALPHAGLTQQECEDQFDFWTTKLTVAEERLYNLRNGDVPCQPAPTR